MSESDTGRVPPGAALDLPKPMIDLAVEVSGWSPCRSKRGVVVFKGENVVSHGYNYKPRGFDCDGSDACKATCRVEAVHAEQQALLSAGFAARGADMLHVKSVMGALVSSEGPSCVQCSKLALACGIAGVWLHHNDGWQRYEMADFHQRSLDAEKALRAALDARPPQAPQQRFLTCKRCGCAIDTTLCGYGCDLDGMLSTERDKNDMEVRVYELVRVEALPDPPVAEGRRAQERPHPPAADARRPGQEKE